MPPRISFGGHLTRLLRQVSTAVPALLRQQHLKGAQFGQGNQWSMMPRVSGLGTRLAPALVLSAAWSLLSGQTVRRRWLGGVRRVLFPPSQLPLQIRDLLFAFGYFTASFSVLSQQPLIFAIPLFTAGLVGVPMVIRRCPWLPCAASRSRTHPPYNKRFGEVCAEKSPGVRELLPNF